MLCCVQQVLPILLIVLVTFFSTQTEPVYSLAQDAKYGHQLHTGRLGVSFWVKDKQEFEKTYPLGNYKRTEVERSVSAVHLQLCRVCATCSCTCRACCLCMQLVCCFFVNAACWFTHTWHCGISCLQHCISPQLVSEDRINHFQAASCEFVC